MDSGEDGNFKFKSDKSQSSQVSKFLGELTESLFEVFYAQYKISIAQGRFFSKKRQKILHAILMAAQGLQLVSLVFPPTTPAWGNFSWLSQAVAIIRIDYLMAILNQGMPCYFVAIALTLLPFFSIVLLLVKSYRKTSYDIQNYRLSFTLALDVIRSFAFIPLLCIMTAVYKYQIEGSLVEYQNIQGITLPLPYLAWITPVFVAILLVLTLMETVFQYEQLIANKSSFLYARAHSKIEIVKVCASTLLVYSHFYLQHDQSLIHLLYACFTGFALWAAYLNYLPFYHKFTNYTHSSAYLLLGWVSLVLLLAKLVPNSSMVFFLCTFIPPLLAVIQWNLIKKRKEHIKTYYKEISLGLSNIYQYELLVREYAEQILRNQKLGKEDDCINSLRNKVFELFRCMNKRFKSDNLLMSWEFGFSFGLVKDEGLARIKLRKLPTTCDIEGSYLFFKCLKIANEFSVTYLEEVDFIKFRTSYDAALNDDKNTCTLQLEFWRELSFDKPNIKNIEKIGCRLQASLKSCKKSLRKVAETYPHSQMALQLFGTFLLEVYNNTTKGNELISKAEHEKNVQESRNLSNYDKFTYFDSSNAMLMVSGNQNNLGNIITINQTACDILKVTVKIAKSMNISNFILPPVNKSKIHNRFLAKFIVSTDATAAPLPFLNYFIDANRLLVEIYVQVRCVSVDSSLYFLCGFKRTHLPREVILYDYGVILASTYGFAELVGYPCTDRSLQATLADLVVNDFSNLVVTKSVGEVFQYEVPQTFNWIAMRFVEINVKNYKFKFLMASSDKEEVAAWNGIPRTNNSNEIKEDFAIPSVYSKNIQGKQGIIEGKDIIVEKSLKVTLKDIPSVHFLQETDFEAGMCTIGKVKDITEIKGPKEKKVIEESKVTSPMCINEEPSSISELLDVKDLESHKLMEKRSDSHEINKDEIPVQKPEKNSLLSMETSNASINSSPEAQKLLTGVTKSMKSFKIAFFLTVIPK